MANTNLIGIHHVTAMTEDVQRNYEFITNILGMRLVKKTVNQDDIQTYHTFYADDRGNPGTDLTFFDFPDIPSYVLGTNSISRTGLRVPNDEALAYYLDRFEEYEIENEGIQELFGRKILPFQEADGQRYQLFSDENDQGVAPGTPWKNGPVPEDKAIYGLGPIEITVSYFEDFVQAMQLIFGFTLKVEEENVALLEVGQGGNGGQMIVRKDDTSPIEVQGNGTVHHVSFRVADHQAIKEWEEKYNGLEMKHSGLVDRFYFEALYTRIGHILIEISTDGPGFIDEQESYEELGTTLALPPFLEPDREYIESVVRPFDTAKK
ncbi:glyoxalase family protein [Atopostipes suicloacalis DSM 15692]|uniref:Glyoxalase family protein n=1 Tax=Atopostipes suicloacalis DSM 15692 TaxID=1121025 RepID=A0A1M4UG38_9LACT|nr:VOC family protein [Atopostipes suicloacalis]SHE55752.1 glyoxalase family protein [Atopostipes suicloacalis DSM 15692]